MFNTLLALLAVLTVMAVHAVCELLPPFRGLRGLFRHMIKPARVTTR